MKTGNGIALGIGAVVVAGLAVWAMRPQPVPVEVAAVTRGPFEQAVSDDGKTRVRDRYVVSSPLAGRVARIRLKAGDPVAAGDTVAVLTPAAPNFLDARTERELGERIGAAEAQRLRALAEVQKADALLAQAEADRDRAAKLAAGGFVSATAREQAELALRTAQKSAEAVRYAEDAAKHEEAQARATLVRYRAEGTGRVLGSARWEVKSPVKGSVLKVAQESEGAVALGTPLLEIADPRGLEAVVDILSQESVGVRPGMPVRLELGAGVAPLAGEVRRVEPAAFTKISALGVEEQRVNVVIDFTESLDRLQTVGDGFRVEAHIVVWRAADAVKVPVGALFRDGPGWAVFVIEDGRAHKRPIKTTRRNPAEALVEEGLKPGEAVVIYPPDALKDGLQVEMAKAKAG